MRIDEFIEQMQSLVADGEVPAEYTVQVQVGDDYHRVDAVAAGPDGIVIEVDY